MGYLTTVSVDDAETLQLKAVAMPVSLLLVYASVKLNGHVLTSDGVNLPATVEPLTVPATAPELPLDDVSVPVTLVPLCCKTNFTVEFACVAPLTLSMDVPNHVPDRSTESLPPPHPASARMVSAKNRRFFIVFPFYFPRAAWVRSYASSRRNYFLSCY